MSFIKTLTSHLSSVFTFTGKLWRMSYFLRYISLLFLSVFCGTLFDRLYELNLIWSDLYGFLYIISSFVFLYYVIKYISERLNDLNLPKKVFYIIYFSGYILILTKDFWYIHNSTWSNYLFRFCFFVLIWLQLYLFTKKWTDSFK